MCARKNALEPLPPLLGGAPALILVAAAVLGGLSIACWLVWRQLEPRITADAAYRLDASGIEITPPPPWIQADVRAEVVREAGLDAGLSVLDDRLAEQIADACRLHPWVARVTRVVKSYPAQVRVDLEYRRPVAVVRVEGGRQLELIPLDADGVRLPADGLSAAHKRELPRLAGVATQPLPGQPWNDAAVLGGARLAAELVDVWSAWGLARIAAVPGTIGPGRYGEFELLTRGGRRIVWGAPPGSQRPGEPTATQKLARLRTYLRQNGTLDASSTTPRFETLDVRDLPLMPRTARRGRLQF